MNFFDDLKTRVEQAGQQVEKDVNAYISNNITEPLVKVGQAATGNLSDAQIKAGQTGQAQTASVLPAAVAANPKMSFAVMAMIGLGAYFLFFSKKSRG